MPLGDLHPQEQRVSKSKIEALVDALTVEEQVSLLARRRPGSQ
jgi:hypothetical protein